MPTEKKKKQIRIDYAPMPWQKEFHSCTARFRIVVNGRQTGKTTAAIHEIVRLALTKPRAVFYWVDPTHKFSLKCLEIFKREYPPALAKQLGMHFVKSQDERRIEFTKNGSKILFFTAQNPDSLVGDAIDGVVVNEAGLIENPDIWNQMIRPALGVKEGIGIFVSTPRNKNWFYDLFNLGKRSCKKWDIDWEQRDMSCDHKNSYHTFQNPTTPETSLMSREEILLAKESPGMTHQKFRMEYLAEFLEESSEVFRNFRKCIKGSLEDPRDKSYYIGVDLGKQRDFTVITVIDRDKNHVVHFDRFNGVDWPVIENRVASVASKYRGKTIVDGTGVGDAICSNLRRRIHNLEVVVINNARKVEMVENLISAIEHEDISFPDIPELTQELSDFTYKLTPSGNVQYHGRMDAHDDCVISLALAYWPMRIKPVRQLTPKQIKMVRRIF